MASVCTSLRCGFMAMPADSHSYCESRRGSIHSSPQGQVSPFGTSVTVQGRPTGGDLVLFMSEEINGMLVWK